MNKSNIAISVLLLIGLGIVITGTVLYFRNPNTDEYYQDSKFVEQIALEEKQRQREVLYSHITQAPQDRKISPKFNYVTSTLRTKLKPRRSPFQKCSQQDNINNPKLWSVKMEACTNNVATPLKGVIENMRMAADYDKLKFELHENGFFEIKENGFYEILTKVTFLDNDDHNQYSINILDPDYHSVGTIKSRNGTHHGDEYVIISNIHGNVTEKLTFYVEVPRNALIYLHPHLTYFTVTKYK